jgi:DNA invertase Pin-like site-specific DNA recombinase
MPEGAPSEPAGAIRLVALGYQCSRAGESPLELARNSSAIEDFCTRKGWDLLALQHDVDSGPPKAPGQPALMHAVEQLRGGEAACLVVAELRALCPSVAELGHILEALEEVEARLVSLEPPFDTGTPIGRAVVRMLTAVSAWERSNRAHRTAKARSKAGHSGEVPSKVRRRIVQMRRAGMTLQAIADRLNEEGVPTVRGGAMWRPSSVQATLGYKRPRPWEVSARDS